MKRTATLLFSLAIAAQPLVHAKDHQKGNGMATVADDVIAMQRKALAKNTSGKGFGPQSPRDIDLLQGKNTVAFGPAPSYREMNLCNVHFHKNAEHKGGQFTAHVGNGNGQGYHTGYRYTGMLSQAELEPVGDAICPDEHGGLVPGDTIELHYVHTSAQVTPGPTLGACLSESIGNPQLRVEAQVYVLVNDKNAHDFRKLAEYGKSNGLFQAPNIPQNSGVPVQYTGSTTGPAFNEKGSPLQVSWSVRPNVMKVNIETVGKWCKNNAFNESKAHGVRNLVTNPDLLSEISY